MYINYAVFALQPKFFSMQADNDKVVNLVSHYVQQYDHGRGAGLPPNPPRKVQNQFKPCSWLVFAFDMFGLFLEVFIVPKRKLKIDISLGFGQLPEQARSKPTLRKKIIFQNCFRLASSQRHGIR